jgi:hypothetical protein
MISNTRSSPSTQANAHLEERGRSQSRDGNIAWLQQHESPKKKKMDFPLSLVLLGGTGALDLRLRVAQSHVRHDMTPSSWSHVLLLEPGQKPLAERQVHEVSLAPRRGFGFAPRTNGLQAGKLAAYDDARRFPNVAILHVPLPQPAVGAAAQMLNPFERVEEALRTFRLQRGMLDVVELITLWLPFLWGVGATPNPLLGGHGIPSAVMAEAILAACGFDISPSISSRASCPETIWQAARWWHEHLEQSGGTGAIEGSYTAPHALCSEESD